MPSFGPKSKQNLSTCEVEIQDVLNEAIKYYDFSCIDGHRDMETQNTYFNRGVSQVRWPNSRHNTYPSEAVDVVPYPGGFDNDDSEFYKMATFILAAASKLGVRLDWGGHWKNFKDLAHFELDRDVDNG